MRIMPFMRRKNGVQFAGVGLDIGSGGSFNFSTDEQVTTQKWTDGKPIYVKTFVVTNGSSPMVLQGVSNVDTVVDYTAYQHRRYGVIEGFFLTGTQVGSSAYFNLVLEKMSDNTLRYESDANEGGWVFIKNVVTVYYTKTTD